MKRIILPFLIVAVCSFGTIGSQAENMAVVSNHTIQVKDSLDLFRDITDISRQMERRTQPTPVVIESGTVPPIPTAREIVPIIPVDSTLFYRNPLDSIYFRRENGTLRLPENYNTMESMNGLTFRDTLFYNPLFLPMIFTGDILPSKLSFYPLKEDRYKGSLIPLEKTFAPRLDHLDFVQDVRHDYYVKYPDRIRYCVASFDSIPQVKADDKAVRETFNPFRDLIKTETTYSLQAPGGVEGVTIRKKYWVRSGEHSFQFAENYISENWHKGGTNNLNFTTYNAFRANYKKEKVRFNNLLEWRLSIFNSPDDSLRKYRIGSDLIRYYGDFGIDAFGKGWSYSTNLEAKSQILSVYPVNSNDLRSSFLSPLYVNAGVGLKYTLDKASSKVRHRKVRLDLSMAPISINYKYVWNDSVNVKRFGIPEDKKGLLDIGSTVTATLKYNITKYITWDSKLSYFTSYEKVISDFENRLDLSLSNAFSTQIYFNLRYDDGVPPHEKLKYLQFNHMLSFGLNYKW